MEQRNRPIIGHHTTSSSSSSSSSTTTDTDTANLSSSSSNGNNGRSLGRIEIQIEHTSRMESDSTGANSSPHITFNYPFLMRRDLSQASLPSSMQRNRIAERERNYYRQYYLRRYRPGSSSSSSNDSSSATTASAAAVESSSTTTVASTTPPTSTLTNARPIEFETTVYRPNLSRIASQIVLSPIQVTFPATPTLPLVVSTSADNVQNNRRNMNVSSNAQDVTISTLPPSSATSTSTANQTEILTTSGDIVRNVFERLHGTALQLNRDGHWFNLQNGLTKQEINRHTISYEYKPKKRKRMKRIVDNNNNNNNGGGGSGECSRSFNSQQNQTSESEVCSICLDHFCINITVRRLPCLHVFHIKCIDKWLKQNKKCPICRISIAIDYEKMFSSLNSGISIEQCLNQQESSLGSNIASFLQELTDLQQLVYDLPTNNGMARHSLFNYGQISSNNNDNNNNNNNNSRNNNDQQQQTASINNNNDNVVDGGMVNDNNNNNIINDNNRNI
ncbi:uncharacterized protein LOC124491152 isoform X1 [Dermatophagoides farinae]|uniref:uncharacterized protein LOC124491152 isoform X1 n=1 Tax=Dermatophagoides farinae TaxID=6954 RepID=UPI003F636812